MTTVTITEEPLALEDLLAVVDGAQVELADSARAVIAASRAVVDRALSSNEAVYGLTTQVGHGKDTRLTEEEIRGEQMFLVMSHSGGVGRAAAHPAGTRCAGRSAQWDRPRRVWRLTCRRRRAGGDAECRRAPDRPRDRVGRSGRSRPDGRDGSGHSRVGPGGIPGRAAPRR